MLVELILGVCLLLSLGANGWLMFDRVNLESKIKVQSRQIESPGRSIHDIIKEEFFDEAAPP